MVKERSAGAVVFKKKNQKIYYLLLHYNVGHWDFPKGHVEKGETDGKAAAREIAEETGIKDVKMLENFKEEIRYHFRGKYAGKKEIISKEVIFFLAETKTDEVVISFEHQGFDWLCFKDALERVTFKTSKDILIKANKFLGV